MRVCIVAVDGLEYRIVENLNLKNLMQNSYGTYPVAADRYNTPSLWASFITGLQPEEHGIKMFVERRWGIHKLKKLIESLKLLGLARRFTRSKIGYKVFPIKPPTVRGKFKTIFDYAKKPLPYNVFSYNEEEEQFKLRYNFSITKVLEKKYLRRVAVLKWFELTKKLMNNFLDLLTLRDWDLAMTHLYITDYIGHVMWGTREFIKSYYLVDNFVKTIHEVIPDETLLLIVSDHGMWGGKHSDKAFYSFNKNISWKPCSITDFYPKIISWLKGIF